MLLLVGSGRALGTVWRLSMGARLVAGRKDAPLLIEGDRSVSRVHATVVTLADDMSGVDIEDEGSKFGIHINGHSCPGRATSRLNIGDTIMFGAQDSTFELRRSPISLCIANMRSEPPSAVHAILANAGSLGLDIVDDVECCTHLVTPVLAVTSKLIRALVFGCWIVSPAYIQDLASMPLAFKVDDPSVGLVDKYIGRLAFLPSIQEPTVSPESPVDLSSVSWRPNKDRQSLFSSRVFAFSEQEQMNKYASLIKASGGSSVLLNAAVNWACLNTRTALGFRDYSKDLASSARTFARESSNGDTAFPLICLVLPVSPPSLDDTQDEFSVSALVRAAAQQLVVRAISESEIGLAVLFVCSSVHTNPVVSPQQPNKVLQETQDSSSIPVNAELNGADSRNHIAYETSDPPKRRRAARISSFWAAKVAADAVDSHSSNLAPKIPLENTRASMEALSVQSPTEESPSANNAGTLRPKRRVGVDSFWANAVSEGMHRPQRTSEEQFSSGGVATHMSTPGAQEHEDNTPAIQAPCPDADSLTEVEVVPLVRPKHHAATCQGSEPLSAGTPNFKRFKKTVHLYQVI